MVSFLETNSKIVVVNFFSFRLYYFGDRVVKQCQVAGISELDLGTKIEKYSIDRE